MPEMTYAEASLLQAQNKRVADLEAENERLREVGYGYRDRMREAIKENERLREDAERYRYLAANNFPTSDWWYAQFELCTNKQQMDDERDN